MIHVKIFRSSAVLSHLFMQGKNAAELLLDNDFLAKANEKIETVLKNNDQSLKEENFKIQDPLDYEVIFAIIIRGTSKSNDNLPNIPFFSKLTFCDAYKTLEKIKYKVSIKAINWN